ncbi:amino acid adenylation domain-containing protein [Streptomyces sp. NPDC054765]
MSDQVKGDTPESAQGPSAEALLEQRLAGRTGSGAQADRGALRPLGDLPDAPLSFGQERLWFLHEFQPGSVEYTSSVGLRLTGDLRVDALRTALGGLIARHEPLRTTFATVDGRAHQVVRPAADPEIRRVDLTQVPAGDREAELDRLLRAELGTAFDLATGPVLRVVLAKLGSAGHGGEEHVLFLNMHHIAADGWSKGILMTELGELYAAALEERAPRLGPLPVTYRDYAVWQREHCTQADLDAQLDYWKAELADIAPLELPTDRPRPAVRTTVGALHTFQVPGDVAQGLDALAAGHGGTLFSVLTAATQVLLSRHCGQRDVALGTVSVGRDRTELEPLVGFFVNTLVLRAQIDPEMPFDELVERTTDRIWDALSNQDIPFHRLVDALQTERDPSRTPLVQAALVLQNAPGGAPGLKGLQVTDFRPPSVSSIFDMTLEFEPVAEGGLAGSVEYNTDLFDASTIDALCTRLQVLLAGIVADSGRPVGDLPLLTDDERTALTTGWTENRADFPADTPVHTLITAQAAATPDNVAVVGAGATLDYRELDERSSRLAHLLLDRGAAPGDHIAICLPRGPELVVATLAVLKAGCAYVPIDPDYPADRIAFVLGDTAAPLCLTERRLFGRLPDAGTRRICLDEETAAIAAFPAHTPQVTVGAQDAAYVIYTSGSTGRPKGVVVEHRSIVRLISDADYAPLEADDVVAQAADATFDAATFESWAPLVAGARIAVVAKEVLLDPHAFARALERLGVTTMFLTTAVFNQVVDVEPGAFRGLRHLLVGGEALSPRRVAQLLAGEPPRRFANIYGPTETTTFATFHEIHHADGVRPVPIGRPIRNTTVHVLDERRQPVPVGSPGELYIGGPGVARGYLGLPELTEERFLPAPFSSVPGERVYRTGDRVRWLPDGTLDFLGRVDNQVKVRGYRIEPGEVEAVLEAHPAVAAALVIARTDGERKRLVGYVRPEAGSQIGTAELREFTESRLPGYTVPSAFVTLEQFPLTPNGKVDQRALPAPEERTEERTAFQAPAGEAEEALAEVWSQVLGVDRVGAQDNFFELGGDSILSIQVVAKARQAGLAISSKDIFSRQTLADLARATAPAPAPAVEEDAQDGAPAPLTPVQRWFFEHHTARPAHFNQSVLLTLDAQVDERALSDALRAVVRHHGALRTRFTAVDGELVQQGPDRDTPDPGIERIALGDLAPDERDAAMRKLSEAAQADLDPFQGRLLRCLLFDRGAQDRPRLLLTVHHLAVDGVSWRILLEDLESAYRQVVRGGKTDLGAASTPYLSWARRLADFTEQGGFQGELKHWTDAAAAKVTAFPTDRNGRNTFEVTHEVPAGLDEQRTRQLLQEVPKAYRTQVNDILLTALGRSLARHTGQERTLISLEGHGREEILDGTDISRTVGWFTSIFPVLLDSPADRSWRDLILSTKESLRAVPHRGIGYGALRYLATDEPQRRALADGPRPEVSFNYLGQWSDGTAGSELYRGQQFDYGQEHSPREERPHLLDFVGEVRDGRLAFTVHYSSELYDRDTVQALADDFIAALEELIEHCLRPGTGGAVPGDFPLVPLDQRTVDTLVPPGSAVEDIYPLTPMQSGMLYHALNQPDGGAYFDHVSFLLEGVEDIQALGAAWQHVVDHTPALRTHLRWEGVPRPVQIVAREARLKVRYLDWTDTDASGRRIRLRELVDAEQNAGIDLTQAPLMRLVLIRERAAAVRVVWSFHHVILDGWSSSHLFADVFAQYRTLVDSGTRPAERRRQRPPFRDYVAWLGKQDRAAAEAHWRTALAGMYAPTPLPYGQSLPPGRQSQSAAQVRAELTGAETEALTVTVRRHRLTLNTAVQGAWAMLLARHSGTRDVCFGSTVAGRPTDLPGADAIVGNFLNTLPVRTQVPDTDGLIGWLRDLQEAQAEARDFEYAALGDIQSWSELPRATGLFNTVVVFENYPGNDEAAQRNGLWLRELAAVDTTSFPLDLTAFTDDGELVLQLSYDPQLYDHTQAESLAEQLVVLLNGIAATPEQRVGEVPMLSLRERDRVVYEWNRDTVPFEELCLHEIFAQEARLTPDADAVIFENQVLSYAELDARANQLAHHLLDQGVGPDAVIAICLERGPDMVTAALAVLKAGGAYLPLDPGHPAERHKQVLDDSDAAMLLTQQTVAGRLPLCDATVLRLDAEWADIEQWPPQAPTVEVTPDSLAYVIYTSGSTGRPKGVMVEHRSVSQAVAAWGRVYGVEGRPARQLNLASMAFDVFVSDLGHALCFGGALVISPASVTTDPPRLFDLMERARVTHLETVPSLANALLDEADRTDRTFPPLRYLAIGSDNWRTEDCRRLLNRVSPDTIVLNSYGVTEATVESSVFPVRADSLPGTASVPIGRPIPGTRMYILDAGLRPVPVGVVGELFLGGPGVARGYLNRPDLTEERFLQDPFMLETDAARLYRTGDRARFLPSGDIEFLGRSDDQVKIRGFRVELAEIETAMRRHPGIADAAATVRPEADGSGLTGYLVPVEGAALDLVELRGYLGGLLPRHMVPQAFVELERLPLNSNGKVDRRALPSAPAPAEQAETARTAPRTPAEESLAAVWAQVFRIPSVGVEDNFFDLGGDSILSIQVVARARELGLRLSSQDIFSHQTVAELASVVSARNPEEQADVSMEPVVGRVPLTPIQRTFFRHHTIAPHHYTMSVLADLAHPPAPEALQSALDALLDHHDVLRTRFTSAYGRWQQEIAAPGDRWPLERIELDGDDGQAVEKAAATAQSGLDLSAGPLVRALLFDHGEGAPQLFLTAHHLIVDAVSWQVLLADLERGYRQAAEGRPVDLGAKSSSFLEWSRRLSEHTVSGAFDEELDYWAGVAGRAEPGLPADAAGTPTVASAASVRVSLDAADTEALLREVPVVYRTQVNDVLLSAVGRVLADWTGRSAVLIDLEGHGREEIFEDLEIGATTGWFTSSFPVALDAPAGEDWGALLRSVKEQLRAVPRRGIGYGALRHLSPVGAPAEVLAEAPRAQVSFNYLGRMTSSDDGSGLVRDSRLGFGTELSPAEKLEYLLDIVAWVRNGRLEFELFHSTEVHHAETVERLGEELVTALRALAAHCKDPGGSAAGATPSDFPLATVDQRLLDTLAADGGRIADLYPVTPMQHGLLFHSLTEEGEGVYLGQLSFVLEGGVDTDAFAAAWQRLADRTPMLRTAVVWEDTAEPLQVVREQVRVPVERLDHSALTEQEAGRRLDAFLAEDRTRGIDLTIAPLMRLTLIEEPGGGLRVVWTSHHLLLDGWSAAELIAEVLDHYLLLTGHERPEPAARRPFRDYVQWLGRQDLGDAEQYWKQLLDGFTMPTPLPVDHSAQDATRAGTEASSRFQLAPDVTKQLEALARRHRLTANTLAQGAWALLLSRYAGEREVCFGSAVSGRPADLPGVESMIGLFINNLPVRATIRDDQPLLEWLADLQRSQVASRQHEYVSLAQIRGWAELPAGVDLFDSYVVFENYPYDGDMGAEQGVRIRDVRSLEPTSYGMVLAVFAGEQLSFRLAYDPALFEARTAERVTADLRALLEDIARDPDRTLREFPALSEEHRTELLTRHNATDTELLSELPVAEQFARQAARTPEATALVHDADRLTFAELDGRANQLARHLVDNEVGPEVTVGVCFERGSDLIVSLLAVLKAGGIYAPLDPEAPAERLAYLLADTRPRVLLTQERIAAALPAAPGTTVVKLDADRAAIEARPDTAPELSVGSENAAYIIHTSGSTGRPKGVVVEHRGLANLLDSHRRTVFGPLQEANGGQPLRVAHLAPASFDASWNPVLWLVAGHELHLVPDSVRRDAHALSAYQAAERIDFLQTTPSYFQQLLDTGLLADGRHPLGGVALGGEAIGDGLWELLRARKELVSFNFYGPTEATVDALITPISDSARPLLGHPVQNVRAYVLDEAGNLAPTGAPGELHLAGDGLARGYLNQPELSERAFLPAPFDPKERVYRTGDRVRRLADGRLEFLGRLDDQIKLRGYRIELGEISSVLDGHPAVAQSVAVVRGEDELRRLVAYFRPTGTEGAVPDGAELARYLAERLPSYLIPAAFVALDAFPLTRHGKVDRNALPDPETVRPDDAAWVAPRNETERLVAQIWAETLDVDNVGAHDSFFALGGQSLTSVKAITRIKKTFGVRLAFRSLLDTPTVSGVAQLIEDALLEQLERAAAKSSGDAVPAAE